jgi:hypothetical protein
LPKLDGISLWNAATIALQAASHDTFGDPQWRTINALSTRRVEFASERRAVKPSFWG